jgi:hypothetical protein
MVVALECSPFSGPCDMRVYSLSNLRQGDFRDEEGFKEAYARADRGEVT